jgi:SprB repeat
MFNKSFYSFLVIFILVTVLMGGSCNKGDTPPPPPTCTGVTINVTNTASTIGTPCLTPGNGSLTVSATGGSGTYTYSVNNGPFQSGNVFNALTPGSYTVTAKDANNCTGTLSGATVPGQPAGTLFTSVKTMMQTNCASGAGCHSGSNPAGGHDWTKECEIVAFKASIKARAIDATPSIMPPTGALPAVEKQKITDWITAGGLYTN